MSDFARFRSQLLRALSIASLTIFACSTAVAAQTLSWDANAESDLSGYIVQYGTQSGNPSTSLDVGQVTSRTFTGLTAGTTYYFRVVAYNSTGQQSTPSTQVSYAVPSTPPPTGPTITTISPTSGPLAGGTVITISGTNFAAGATVRVGGTTATGVSVASSTQITASTPAGTSGAKTVQVTSGGVTATSPVSFTYTGSGSTPTITALSPTSGPTAGGTSITISGTNFASGATVRVGGVAATNVNRTSANRITASTPAGTAGTQSVQVTSGGTTVTSPVSFTYTGSTSTPTITALSPTSGPMAGGTTITISGTNFASGATVRVGGVVATNVNRTSANSMTASTPAGTAGARNVQVTNPSGQSASLANGFTYTSGTTLSITSISPASGPTAGNTAVVIRGANFVAGGDLYVSIGGEPITAMQLVSSTELRGRTPAGSAGVKNIRFTNGNAEFLQVTGAFTYSNSSTATAAETASARAAVGDDSDSDGLVRRYLAEGVEGDQMHTQLAIANADVSDAHVLVTFMSTTGAATTRTVDVPARGRSTMDLSTVPELAGQSFSTVLASDRDVAVDRLISWDARGGAASLESAVDRPAQAWYFAEGSTVDPYELFYLVQNPGATAAKVRVRYLLPGGAAPIVRSYTVAPGSRATIWVDREATALAATDVAAEITSVVPIVVERSLYLKDASSDLPRGGDTSVGVTAPATTWTVEAATGAFSTRLLIANPGGTAARVQATYQTAAGARVVTSHVVAANSRETVDVAAEAPALADAVVDVKVDASAPVVVERTSSWGANGTPDETISGGATATGAARWLLAEAELGGDRQAAMWLAVTNRGAATNATVTLLFEEGPEASATFAVAAGARVAIPVAEAFPMAANRRFSVLVEGEDPAASLIVDRAIFWHAAGQTRTAGADGAATRLP